MWSFQISSGDPLVTRNASRGRAAPISPVTAMHHFTPSPIFTTAFARLVFGRVRQNLAAYLLGIASERGQETAEGIALGVKITRSRLAGLVAASRETVHATLLEFRRRGPLAVHGRSILLTDPATQCALANDAHVEGR